MKGKVTNGLIVAFFIIVLVISLFFIYQSHTKTYDVDEESSLELSELVVKILLKEGETFQKSIGVTNIGSFSESISVSIDNLQGLVFLEENSFNLRSGQTKSLDFSFISSVDDISFEPGVYVGSLNFLTGSGEVILPVIVEIESEEVLFDMNLDLSLQDRFVFVGGSALADVAFYNFGDMEIADVDVNYGVTNIDGVSLLSENENVVVESQALVSKTVSIPENFEEGKYVFFVIAEYGDSVGTASYIFDVSEEIVTKGVSFCSLDDPLCWLLVVVFVLLVVLVILILVFLFRLIVPKKKLPMLKEEKLSFFARWKKKREEKRKERERKRKAQELVRKREERKKLREGKKVQEQKLREKLKKELKKEKEALKIERQKLNKERIKVGKKPKFVPEKKELVVVKKETKKVFRGDPHKKVRDLLVKCKKEIEKRNFLMADSYFQQISPFMNKLTFAERDSYGQEMVDLQNKLTMLELSEFRDSLYHKRKVHKKKVKKKVKHKKLKRKVHKKKVKKRKH